MDIDPWMGEMEAFLERTPSGLEWRVIAHTFDREARDIVITYDAAILKQLVQKGKVSKEIGEPLVEHFDKLERDQAEYRKFLDENPLASDRDKADAIQSISLRDIEKEIKRMISVRHLVFLKSVIEEEQKLAKMRPLFKKHLRLEDDFGITKAVMDRLVYLPELLMGARLTRIEEDSDHYSISSRFSSSSKEPIGLEYYFIAPDPTAASQIFALYIEEMGKEALKVLLGFWMVANDRGMFDYTANITEIMEKTADPGRGSYFSVKEKKRFWALSKLLENTKLTLVIPFKSGTSKEKTLTIEHRLIEISARGSENGKETEYYPNQIKVGVLNPEEFKEKAQLATAIANGTARLPPQDIMLALTIQTRAAQRRDVQDSQFDEDFLIDRGNLQKTRDANPRVARQRLKEKLNRIQKGGAIVGWEKSDAVYRIKRPQNSRKDDKRTC